MANPLIPVFFLIWGAIAVGVMVAGLFVMRTMHEDDMRSKNEPCAYAKSLDEAGKSGKRFEEVKEPSIR